MRRGKLTKSLWRHQTALLIAALLVPAFAAGADKRNATKANTASSPSTSYRVIGWNDLGMHCVDGNDYSVFSILPPYNNLHVQLVTPDGKLVKSPTGLTLTYKAVADPDGSINRTSIGKTNFWDFVLPLFGVKLAPDMGLAGKAMPGVANVPRALTWDTTNLQWKAEGIPITPYPDGGGAKNYYPLMRVVAKSTSGGTLGTTDVVLPVSDEMDCRGCHATGTEAAARPPSGWVTGYPAEKDYKFNILRLHDSKRDPAPWKSLLAQVGYNPAGLEATAKGGTPVLCAKCHLSNALPGTGFGTIQPLTQAIHGKHAMVLDPTNNQILDSANNRSACYRCHPGSETKCLRGAMGHATAADGSNLMQCQSCHGGMSQVASATRKGWLQEPSCENCHTGIATRNSGAIRFLNAYDANGSWRQPADSRFASNTGKLYRTSAGHGKLQCEACHGSTHAEYPTDHRNDNLQNNALQGRAGTLSECGACHVTTPSNYSGGPHGMHPVGAFWVDKHHDYAESRGVGECQGCHGVDYRGTVLSRTFTARTFSHDGKKWAFAAGTQIGCYNCHNGPKGGD